MRGNWLRYLMLLQNKVKDCLNGLNSSLNQRDDKYREGMALRAKLCMVAVFLNSLWQLLLLLFLYLWTSMVVKYGTLWFILLFFFVKFGLHTLYLSSMYLSGSNPERENPWTTKLRQKRHWNKNDPSQKFHCQMDALFHRVFSMTK